MNVDEAAEDLDSTRPQSRERVAAILLADQKFMPEIIQFAFMYSKRTRVEWLAGNITTSHFAARRETARQKQVALRVE